ncbi:hypothetical protein [Chamaesiphon polymorphus]|uniref:Uncharacterized protein n=1 Tax=Chamaesiphon polymorphus CCALA 037 TaxID=2107692 RepID=A0A2T1GH72_9CYAN|nr:hypothetical protein [Chamaesiphon polymorphus]PSB57044.1 hypothetical protein C7B77_09760 [Chamaesiphon polymorphus CCALA 037]
MANNYNNPQERTEAERRRLAEAELQYQRERSAEDSGTANGLVIGSILVALVGLGSLAAYYLNRPAPTPTTIINTPPTPAASVSPAPPKQTTIIDRTVEKTAPPKVVEVEKPVAVPVPAAPKVVEVEKPVIVPGETKVIRVPTPAATPTPPSAADKSNTPAASPTPSVPPSTPAGEGTDSPNAPDSSNTAPANNN